MVSLSQSGGISSLDIRAWLFYNKKVTNGRVGPPGFTTCGVHRPSGTQVLAFAEGIAPHWSRNTIKDPLLFVQQALQHTVAIVESNSKPGTWLYYAPMKNGLYYPAVANTHDQRIKTASISGKIKKGEMIWQSSRLEI